MAVINSTRTVFTPANGSFFTRALAAFTVWNDARITRKALSRLSDRELSDIGLSRGEIDTVAYRHSSLSR